MKIKRFINSILACAMVCTAVPYVSYSVSENISITANAVDEAEYTEGTYESLTYKAYSDRIEIIGFDESATEVTIPSEIDGLPVTSIGDSAFYDCWSLVQINIPNSVTSIGDEAFFLCTELTKITIPDSVTSIGEGAFYLCSGLTEINIPDSVTSIGEGAFSYCSELTEINIPYSVTSIGDSAFASCSGLTEITIPDSVTSIGNHAFVWCSLLQTVTISDGVESIGKGAFSHCTKLTEINIPDSVTSIGISAFSDCSNLEKITIENPDCILDIFSIPSTATIYGYENSTAQEYAEENKREFVVIGSSENSGIKGDANGDGTVDVADVVAISAYVGDSKINLLDEQLIKNGDVHNTGDGLTANDALMIQQYLSGNITTLE